MVNKIRISVGISDGELHYRLPGKNKTVYASWVDLCEEQDLTQVDKLLVSIRCPHRICKKCAGKGWILPSIDSENYPQFCEECPAGLRAFWGKDRTPRAAKKWLK